MHPDVHINDMLRWLRIREENGKSFPTSLEQFREIVNNSSLLKRLLRGEQALEYPPPLSYDHPWYGLMEDGFGLAGKVLEGDQFDRKMYGCDVLWINDYGWRIIKKISDQEYVITYGNGFVEFKAFTCDDFGGHWRIERVTSTGNSRISI